MKCSVFSSCLLFSCLSLVLLVPRAAQAEGKGIYEQRCSGCHGRLADKKAMDQAPALNTLSEDVMIEGLKARRDGKIEGKGNRAKANLTDEQIVELAKFINGLPK
ncbi:MULTISPECIES: c-type cytochrome [unclassified Rahnella]|uniref:c-type cytochrome n=1 Tax=Rahnella TaxID=34037 RepID=UPI0005620453|nr:MULTISPECIES: c-type cytochrome [unclassified Rahnella]MQB56130.1 cytochrome c [Rahnella sp. RcJ3]RKT89323.1 cytochrome c553 [Rahnella aquatilis]